MPKKSKTKKGGEDEIKSVTENTVKGNTVIWSKTYLAEVVDIFGRTGMSGEASHVLVRVLEGPNAGKVMRRNVMGPVKIGDLLMLRETEIEATEIETK